MAPEIVLRSHYGIRVLYSEFIYTNEWCTLSLIRAIKIENSSHANAKAKLPVGHVLKGGGYFYPENP